jgi:hypothetical protein
MNKINTSACDLDSILAKNKNKSPTESMVGGMGKSMVFLD